MCRGFFKVFLGFFLCPFFFSCESTLNGPDAGGSYEPVSLRSSEGTAGDSAASGPLESETPSRTFSSSTSSTRSRSSLWSEASTPHTEQLENSVELMKETLFQDLQALPAMHLSQQSYGPTIKAQSHFFRRLFLLMGLSGLRYRPEGVRNYGMWPFPLTTALTQGQRLFIELQGVTSEEFLSWLTGGHLHLLQRRKYSSHGVQEKDGFFEEKKIKSLVRRIKRNEKLFGMNFPLGGLGNPLPNGDLVGPYGFEYSVQKRRLSKKKQVGHLHVYTHDFPDQRHATILMGIEGCAPGTSNQFGCKHTALSGLRNQKLNRSTSGGLKWAKMKDLTNAPPAEYKGKFIVLTKEVFEVLKKRVYTVMNMPVQEQKRIFSIFLPKNGEDAKKFLSTYDGWIGS